MSVPGVVLFEVHPRDGRTQRRPGRGLFERFPANRPSRGKTFFDTTTRMAERSRRSAVRAHPVRTWPVTAASVRYLRTIGRERAPAGILVLGDPLRRLVLNHHPQIRPQPVAKHDP